MTRSTLLFASTLLLFACDGDPPGTDAGPGDAGPMMEDAAAGDAGSDAGGGDTWASWAQGFFSTYCTECHAGGLRDFTTITEVQRDANTIRCGVSTVVEAGCGSFPPPGQFPVGSGPFPSDAERARLVAWLNAGLPE